MEKLCIECNKSGTFLTRKKIIKGNVYLSTRRSCNKCVYKKKVESEKLKLAIYG